MSENLIGRTIGRLTVLSVEPPKSNRRCIAKCSCGSVKQYSIQNIKTGHTQSCGCLQKELILNPDLEDLIGQTFGRLTIVSITKHSKPKYSPIATAWCRCGSIKQYNLRNVKSGHTLSCGCLQKEITTERNLKHGLTNHPLFGVWSDMKKRCYCQTSKKYKDWGGRGITVCDEWLNDFPTFYNWALTHNYQKGLTLDRENNELNYSPNNCRFVTQKINNRNKRSTRLITFNNQTKSLVEWAEFLNVPYTTLAGRINTYKWPIERALSTH